MTPGQRRRAIFQDIAVLTTMAGIATLFTFGVTPLAGLAAGALFATSLSFFMKAAAITAAPLAPA